MMIKNLKTLMLFGTVFSSILNAQTQTSIEDVVVKPIEVKPIGGVVPRIQGSFGFGAQQVRGSTLSLINPDGTFNQRVTNFGFVNPVTYRSFWQNENGAGYRYTNYFTNSDPFSCVAPDDAISNLAEATNTQECYDKKHSYQRPDPEFPMSEKQLIESDKAVCECLYEKAKTLKPLQEVLDAKVVNLPNIGTSNNIVQNFRENRINAQKRMYRRVAGLSFQASIISDGDSVFSAAYTANTTPPPINADPSILQRLLDGSRFMSHSKVKERDVVAAGLAKELQLLDVPVTPFRRLYVEAPFNASLKQCVGGREYQAFKSLPSDDLLFAELRKGEFKPFEWNYNSLKDSYKNLVQLPIDEKRKNAHHIAKLKSKLLFLESNQMIKSIFSAQTADKYEEFLKQSKISIHQKNKITETATELKIGTMQNELHGILKDFADVGKRCQGKDKACFQEATKSGGTAKFKEALNTFFSKPEVFTMAKAQTDKENFDESKALLNDDNFLPPESSRPENYTQELLTNKFMNSTALGDPDTCKGGADYSKCAEIYSAYCKTVDSALDAMRGVDGEDTIKDDLDVKTENLLNTDIATNRDFAAFNKEICNTPMRKNPRDQNEKPMTFFDFKVEYCKKYNNPPECGLRSPKDYESIRLKYQAEYKHPADPGSSHMSATEREAFYQTSVASPVKSMNEAQAATVARGDNNNYTLEAPNNNSQASAQIPATTEKAVPFSSVAKGLSNLSNAMGGSPDGAAVDETQMNYSNTVMGGTQASTQTTEVPKIENMPQTEREELLEDWKKEMADWKAKKDSPDASQSAVASANETAMKAKIEALEQLLAQQKKLTDDQYKLLNDSIAAQTRTAERSIASVQDDSEEGPQTTRRRSSNGIVGSNPDVDDETQRGPGSIQDNQLNTSGSGAGAAAAASSRSRSSTSNAISDSSRDSVAREEAKLVNLRENTNGSITITSTNSSAGASSANAIVVSVSDAFYQSAQSNPTGLNLSQLEQSIPKDQIAKLQDKGDYFILLLQNGSNPPLEVKVKKENNKLVQVDGAPIVSRRVSLDSLRNTLK